MTIPGGHIESNDSTEADTDVAISDYFYESDSNDSDDSQDSSDDEE